VIRSPVAILAILTALNLLNYLDRYLIVGVGTGLQAELQINDGQFGDVITAFMWGYFVTSPLFGWLGDRYRRKWLIAAGVAVWCVATVISGLAASYGAMLAARVVVGVGEASYATLSPTIIDDIAKPSSKNKWLAVFYAAIPVGAALGFLVGGQLEKYFGWRSAFFIAGGPGILLTLLVAFLHEPDRVRNTPTPERGRRIAYFELLRLPRYVFTIVGYVGQTFALGGFAAFAVHFLVRKFHYSAGEATLVFGAITVVAGLGGTAFGGWLADRIAGADPLRANLQICAWSSIVATPLAIVAIVAGSAIGYLAALTVCEVAIFVSTSPANAATLEASPPHLRANGMALSIFAIHLFGDLVSPPAIGRISDAHQGGAAGLQLGLYLVPAALALSGLAWLRGAAYPAPPAQALRGATLTRPDKA
jgi:MFS family permease